MIKQVGNTKIRERHKLTCHCGAVELLLHLPEGIVDLRRCNCSLCRRKGTITARAKLEDLEVVKGAEMIKLYQFNTMVAKHYFCSNCGIHTHHNPRSNPLEYRYNVGCLEDVNPFELDTVPTSDGIHHPLDT